MKNHQDSNAVQDISSEFISSSSSESEDDEEYVM